MHITVYYQSGVIDSFDTQTFCAWQTDSSNICCSTG